MKCIRLGLMFSLMLTLPLMLGCPVRELAINPGFAFFEVQQASPAKDVIGPQQVVIEATIIEVSRTELSVNFFDPNSDPVDAAIPFVGQALQRSPLIDADLDQTDTILEILNQSLLPQIGSQATVQAKVVQMQLVSIDPVEVTYNEGQNPELWDVGLTLVIAAQLPGQLNVTRTGNNSGTASGQLPIIATLEFERQSDDAERSIVKTETLDIPSFPWGAYPNEFNWPQNGRTNMVPGLSMIPFINNLFQRQQVEASRNELLIFITPTIIREDR